eukprot:12353175-Alexandrium_andersonii.AAC.1
MVFEEGMPDDWVPPDWAHADFAGEGAALGAVALHAMADQGRVYRDGEALVREFGLDEHAENYMTSRPVEVIDAVAHRAR